MRCSNMKDYRCILFSSLVLLSCFDLPPVYGKLLTFRGIGAEEKQMTRCLKDDDITEVELKCASSNDVLHIVSFDLSDIPDCPDTNAGAICGPLSPRFLSPGLEECEGRVGSCLIDVTSQSDCDSINHVDMTVTCISRDITHPLCSESSFITSQHESLVLHTPNFIFSNEVGKYNSSITCSCVVTPLNKDSSVHVELLYLDIEGIYEGTNSNCMDWLQIDTSVYCGYIDLLEHPVSMVFEAGQSVQLVFIADPNRIKKGTWLSVSADRGSPFEVEYGTTYIDYFASPTWMDFSPSPRTTFPFSDTDTTDTDTDTTDTGTPETNTGTPTTNTGTPTTVTKSPTTTISDALSDATTNQPTVQAPPEEDGTATVSLLESREFIAGISGGAGGLVLLVIVITAITCCIVRSKRNSGNKGLSAENDQYGGFNGISVTPPTSDGLKGDLKPYSTELSEYGHPYEYIQEDVHSNDKPRSTMLNSPLPSIPAPTHNTVGEEAGAHYYTYALTDGPDKGQGHSSTGNDGNSRSTQAANSGKLHTSDHSVYTLADDPDAGVVNSIAAADNQMYESCNDTPNNDYHISEANNVNDHVYERLPVA